MRSRESASGIGRRPYVSDSPMTDSFSDPGARPSQSRGGEWRPAPPGGHGQRWFDGSQGTDHVLDGGKAGIAPEPVAPPAIEPKRTEAMRPAESRRFSWRLIIVPVVVVVIA